MLHFHPLTIADVRRECGDAIRVRFEVPSSLAGDFRFVQGQHVSLRATVNGEELRRSYSICSGLDDGELCVAIRNVPGGRFSSWACGAFERGMTVDVLPPEGRFFPVDVASDGKHYVAFAAGSGITPVLSVARTVLRREPHSRFTLVYGNRQASTTLFLEELEDLKDRYLGRFVLHTVFSRELQDIELFNGRIDAAKVGAFAATLLPVDTIDEAFVCGPGGMIDEVESALAGLGLDPGRIHVERFGVPSGGEPHRREPADAAQAAIVIELDGVRRQIDFQPSDASILEAALRAGLDLPFSCKGGMCCTCKGKVLEGKVRMDRNYSLDAADVARGFVLTCQSHPLTDHVVLTYDER